MKPKFKVLKDGKKDFKRTNKGMKVTYPMYESKLDFNNKKLKFSIHDFGITYTNIDFKEVIKIPENRIEYGEDYVGANGDLIIISYKHKGKDKLVTGINIIGAVKK